jgi:alkanesulfonate monooxygenase SsuD/methylene tetrahydromethanopterin reductase-like flavin-dependent oxidoreductase (luciferase family)
MKVDASGYFATGTQARDAAVEAERVGYDGWFTPQTQTDTFVASALAATATSNVHIGTAIVVAFARNPMTVALQANHVQLLSEGRFLLGVGSQFRPGKPGRRSTSRATSTPTRS